MLTSPVNVTIAVANGAALKANTAASDQSGRREPAFVPGPQAVPSDAIIEPELPSTSPLTHVNAVAATVGNRTVLQELTLNIANMLRIVRRQDENLTSLFLRIIATIEAMPQAERLQFEIRAGLKPLKITLSDLAMALRKPDGPEAARLTAMTEAPTAVPGRTAATAATTTYLEEGTSNGHTEETLAMRAAARNSAAGQSVFSAESKVRHADAQPADAKVLQNQLKVMFEPGGSLAADPETPAVVGAEPDAVQADLMPETGEAARQFHAPATDSRAARPQPTVPQPAAATTARRSVEGDVTISSSNLRLDPPTVDRIRNAAQAIASQSLETRTAEPDRTAEKTEPGDRRVQTLLTLKGLAEAVGSIPAKAAELLAVVVAEAVAPLPDQADMQERPVPVPLPQASHEAEPAHSTSATDERIPGSGVDYAATGEAIAETRIESGVPAEKSASEQSESVTAEDRPASMPDEPPPARPDLVQHGTPFAYAQLQPAREAATEAVAEEDEREEKDEEGEDEQRDSGERRRPRDEYDAIHDPLPEEEPAIIISRDSSEADRAFALYQRMGGF